MRFARLFSMGRIDPVECIGVSQQRNGNMRSAQKIVGKPISFFGGFLYNGPREKRTGMLFMKKKNPQSRAPAARRAVLASWACGESKEKSRVPAVRRVVPLLCCTLLLLGVCLLARVQEGQREARTSFFAMDTYVTLTVCGKDGDALAGEAQREMERMERLWSVTDPDSELSALNREGEARVGAETAALLRFSLEMAERTDGTLDPTIYPVLTAWGFTTDEKRVPSGEEIAGALERVGYEKVIPEDGGRVRLEDGAQLDLGAVAKGYAGERIAEYLRERGVRSALLDLGGNVEAVGSKPDGSPWKLGLRDPLSDGLIATISAVDLAVVTSGSYERFFIGADGKRYGHILDPSTGYPVDSGLLSATVLAKNGGLADALSTALFVMGKDGAVGHWKKYRDFDMILLTEEKEIWLTPGADSLFSVNSGYEAWERHLIE